jgi:hypothetical protein
VSSKPEHHRRPHPLVRQLLVAIPLVPVWIGGMFVMGFVALGNRHLVDQMLLDANDVAGVKWYVGIVTYLAVLSWCTAAVSALWGAWLSHLAHRRDAGLFLLTGAVITAYVLTDDLLQLHAVFIPHHTGLNKHAAEGLLVVVVVGWLVACRRQIARTRWLVLIGAGLALMASLAIDATAGWGSPRLQLLAEDGAKLLGALGWATYFVATTADTVRSAFQTVRSPS